jgi:predicted nucleic acid-binding protein
VAIEPRVYADSSALVKLIVREAESGALAHHLTRARILTSELAVVEVSRAERIAGPTAGRIGTTALLLERLELVAVTRDVLRRAADLASGSVRSLDAVHLATALDVEPDELVAYDGRLLAAAAEAGLTVSSPGA